MPRRLARHGSTNHGCTDHDPAGRGTAGRDTVAPPRLASCRDTVAPPGLASWRGVLRNLVALFAIAAIGGIIQVAAIGLVAQVASATPLLAISPSIVRPGGEVTARAAGLLPDAQWLVLVCGDGGLGSTSDCSQESGVVVASDSNSTVADAGPGGFVARLTVLEPPVPCPCVVAAFEISPRAEPAPEALAPIFVSGAPYGAVVAAKTRMPVERIVVNDVRLVDRQSLFATLAEWFGGSAVRSLSFDVTNRGSYALSQVPFVLHAGTGPPYSHVLAAAPIGEIRPGETRRVRGQVSLPALWFGTVRVAGAVGGAPASQHFSVSLTLLPWALIVIAALALFTAVIATSVALVRIRRRGHVTYHANRFGRRARSWLG